MKITLLKWGLLALLACPAFARHAPLEWTLKLAEAVAYVRVTSVTETLLGELIYSQATLTVVGESFGMKNEASFAVKFGNASIFPTRSFSSDMPRFILGQRSIVLLKRDGDQWRVLRQLQLSDEGEVLEADVLKALDLSPRVDGNTAASRLISVIQKNVNAQKNPPADIKGQP